MTDDRADPPSVPSEIRAFVARYHEHRETYDQQTYNETQARREFIENNVATAKTDHDKTTLQRLIDATDRQIDQLVYQLYARTPDEIRIVEEAAK